MSLALLPKYSECHHPSKRWERKGSFNFLYYRKNRLMRYDPSAYFNGKLWPCTNCTNTSQHQLFHSWNCTLSRTWETQEIPHFTDEGKVPLQGQQVVSLREDSPGAGAEARFQVSSLPVASCPFCDQGQAKLSPSQHPPHLCSHRQYLLKSKICCYLLLGSILRERTDQTSTRWLILYEILAHWFYPQSPTDASPWLDTTFNLIQPQDPCYLISITGTDWGYEHHGFKPQF